MKTVYETGILWSNMAVILKGSIEMYKILNTTHKLSILFNQILEDRTGYISPPLPTS